MTEVIEHVYTTNAPKGAELLDREFPGWADRIDLAAFNISSYRNCAAALVAGGGMYWDGLSALFPAARTDDGRHELAVEYGFHADVPDAADGMTVDEAREYMAANRPAWAALQADWEHLIEARRTAN